jgi:hypothetical protein
MPLSAATHPGIHVDETSDEQVKSLTSMKSMKFWSMSQAYVYSSDWSRPSRIQRESQ